MENEKMTATYLRKAQGKSDNAYHAQSCGRWPLTRAVKIIAAELKGYYKIPQRIIREWLEAMGPCEWHHVGKYATACDYYDTEPIIEALFGIDEGYWTTNIRGEAYYENNNAFFDEFEVC
jgi:hypothetical protein